MPPTHALGDPEFQELRIAMVLFMLLELEYCFEKATVPLGKLPCCRRTFRIDSVKHIHVEETCGKWWT